MQPEQVSNLIESELARIVDVERRACLEALLGKPRQISLAWEYGREHERFDAWKVGQSPTGDVWLVYCCQGFGPAFPWGFIFPTEDSLGMDSQWHSALEDAAIGAGLLRAPANYESPGPRDGLN